MCWNLAKGEKLKKEKIRFKMKKGGEINE